MSANRNLSQAELIELGVWCHNHPMVCNMFTKRCDLITCHVKRKCLWTEEEGNRARMPQPDDKARLITAEVGFTDPAFTEVPALYNDFNELNTPQ